MYIYIYVYMYVYIRMLHIYIYMWIYNYLHVSKHIHILYVFTRLYIYIYIYSHVHEYIYIHIYIYTSIRIYLYLHIYGIVQYYGKHSHLSTQANVMYHDVADRLYIYIHAHAYLHIYMFVYICSYKCIFIWHHIIIIQNLQGNTDIFLLQQMQSYTVLLRRLSKEGCVTRHVDKKSTYVIVGISLFKSPSVRVRMSWLKSGFCGGISFQWDSIWVSSFGCVDSVIMCGCQKFCISYFQDVVRYIRYTEILTPTFLP